MKDQRESHCQKRFLWNSICLRQRATGWKKYLIFLKFQQSAGILNHLKSTVMLQIQQEPTQDLNPETLGALSALMLAQAQEMFVHKAIHGTLPSSWLSYSKFTVLSQTVWRKRSWRSWHHNAKTCTRKRPNNFKGIASDHFGRKTGSRPYDHLRKVGENLFCVVMFLGDW